MNIQQLIKKEIQSLELNAAEKKTLELAMKFRSAEIEIDVELSKAKAGEALDKAKLKYETTVADASKKAIVKQIEECSKFLHLEINKNEETITNN